MYNVLCAARLAAVLFCVSVSTSFAVQIARRPKGKRARHQNLRSGGEQHRRQRDGLLFIGVITAPENWEKRQSIRNTWMQNRDLRTGTVAASFFIGEPLNVDDELRVITESKTYGDIQRLPVKEGYKYLTEKTLSFFKWFETYRDEPYLMKLDDDTWPHLPRLVHKLQAEQSQYFLLGHIYPCAPVLHDNSKWSEEQFSKWYFPAYPQGSGYILSQGVVNHIVHRTSPQMLHNEDAAVGLWVQKIQHITKVDVKHLNSTVYGCQADDLLTMNLYQGDMECMWRKQQRHRDDICCSRLHDHLWSHRESASVNEAVEDIAALTRAESEHSARRSTRHAAGRNNSTLPQQKNVKKHVRSLQRLHIAKKRLTNRYHAREKMHEAPIGKKHFSERSHTRKRSQRTATSKKRFTNRYHARNRPRRSAVDHIHFANQRHARKRSRPKHMLSLVQGESELGTQTIEELNRKHQQKCFKSMSYEDISNTIADFPLDKFSQPE